MPVLEKTELRRGLDGRAEQGRVEYVALFRTGKSQLALRQVESGAQQFGEGTGAAHARAELRIVVLAAARLIDQRHDMLGAIGIVLREPLAKNDLELMRQA